ncbi:MAG: hypothetical protein A2144_08800 [Chloroflexi bacterium RBG_16_50_9]|nr:MAG: hypothetical protein A2144_08800 [Chloroflexi bacterium RBG_16_50_9]
MGAKVSKWEAELWHYISLGDSKRCPLYDYCQTGQNGVGCFHGETENRDIHRIHRFIDSDEIDFSKNENIHIKFPSCQRSAKIFGLVSKLALKYRGRKWLNSLPVPDNLVLLADDNLPIEIRRVPLRANHGAVWRLSDCWMIHLNKNDPPARQRFTLYHEVFHILSHCHAFSVFKRTVSTEVYYNEILADHFATNVLLPQKSVAARWAEINDVNEMAAIFDVPESVMYIGLKIMRLI